jgi:flavorubredoxin
MDEARRYYANIIGKFGGPVQSILKKLSSESIEMICPLHGPIFRGSILNEILAKYNQWSLYLPEEKSVLLIYGSMYNNTETLVDTLAFKLSDLGVKNMRIYDVAAHDPSYLIAEVFKYSHIVLAIPTYNGDLYYKMHNLLHEMTSLNLQDRKIALLVNGSWGGKTLENSLSILEKMKNMSIIGTPLVIKSSYQEVNQSELNNLALALVESLKQS